jgi:chaperonin cofactor prefoldin
MYDMIHDGMIILEGVYSYITKSLLRYIYSGEIHGSKEEIERLIAKHNLGELKPTSEISLLLLFNDMETSDFHLAYDDKVFYVHKFILVLASEFFANMITLTDNEEEITVFSLDGVLENNSVESLEIALKWMYKRDINVSTLDTSTLFELYCIYNFLSLSFLKRVIELQMITAISSEDVFDCIPFAETHSAQAFLAACYFYISSHYFEVITKHKKQLEEVVDEQTLSKIKKQTKMSVQEIYMLDKFLYQPALAESILSTVQIQRFHMESYWLCQTWAGTSVVTRFTTNPLRLCWYNITRIPLNKNIVNCIINGKLNFNKIMLRRTTRIYRIYTNVVAQKRFRSVHAEGAETQNHSDNDEKGETDPVFNTEPVHKYRLHQVEVNIKSLGSNLERISTAHKDLLSAVNQQAANVDKLIMEQKQKLSSERIEKNFEKLEKNINKLEKNITAVSDKIYSLNATVSRAFRVAVAIGFLVSFMTAIQKTNF